MLRDGIPAFAGGVGNKPEGIIPVFQEINGLLCTFDRLVSHIQDPVKIDEKTSDIFHFYPFLQLCHIRGRVQCCSRIIKFFTCTGDMLSPRDFQEYLFYMLIQLQILAGVPKASPVPVYVRFALLSRHAADC